MVRKKRKKKNNKVDFFWKGNINRVIKKSTDWYWIFWVMNFFLMYFAYYSWENKYLAVLLFLIGFVITFAPKGDAQMVSFHVTDNSFILDNRKEILFKDVEFFNIDYEKNYIFLKLKNNNFSLIEIPFESDHEMEIIEKYLLTKLKKNPELNIPPLEEFFRNLLGFY